MRSSGRSAIFCCITGAWYLRQPKHWLIMFRTLDRTPIIQNRCLINECIQLQSDQINYQLHDVVFFGKMAWCFVSFWSDACQRRPFDSYDSVLQDQVELVYTSTLLNCAAGIKHFDVSFFMGRRLGSALDWQVPVAMFLLVALETGPFSPTLAVR